MGYLHEGHLSLVKRAGTLADRVVMSLFVNPLQFGPNEDLAHYPRDVERDVELAAAAGVDVLFAPDVDDMYPERPVVTIDVGSMADAMEGSRRPGHFAGVAMAVAKLLAGIQPDVAVFGKKDAQQLAIVRRLAADLSLPVEVVGSPTIRDAGGVALSSRNIFLSTAQREAASAIGRGLMAAADAAESGERRGAVLEDLVASEIGPEPELRLDYVTLAATADCSRIETLDRDAFLATAVHVGPTTLIDNIHLERAGGGFTADRGVVLDRPSVLEETT
jgi:pantoate--beta-alanine ligase